jgi:CMP-N,N'-diacetyllegionaminic acid synthase
MLQSSGAPACVSVRPAQEHPYWTFRLGQDGTLASYVAGPERPTVRRQDLPAAWCLNGAVYAARVEWLLRSHTFIAPQTLGYPMPIERSLDIDTAADLESFIRALSFMEKPADV